MTYTQAKKLHNEDEVLLKRCGNAVARVINVDVQKKDVFVDVVVLTTHHFIKNIHHTDLA